MDKKRNLHTAFSTEINGDQPFENDKLGRGAFAQSLITLLNDVSGGAVISINGKWGTGKTTFINMLNKKLSNIKEVLGQDNSNPYCSILINAWEHEYFGDPTLAILSSLKKVMPKENENNSEILALYSGICKGFNNLKKKAAYNAVEVLTCGLIKAEDCSDTEITINEQIEQHNRYKEKDIESYLEAIDSFTAFKNAFQNYINYISGFTGHPVVIFVDELDRCNPKYGVDFLERIKHFFSTDNLIFVLSVDKEQLCHSIKGYFGNDAFDAEDYLRRFIDIELSLPSWSIDQFCKSCLNKMSISGLQNTTIDSLSDALRRVLSYRRLSLRQVEKLILIAILGIGPSALNTFPPDILIPLIYVRCFDLPFFQKMLRKEATMQEVYTIFYPIFIGVNEQRPYHFVALLYQYQNYCYETHQQLLKEFSCVDEDNHFLYLSEFGESNSKSGKEIADRHRITNILQSINLVKEIVSIF